MGTRSRQPDTPKTFPWNLTFFRYKYRLIFHRFFQNSFWVILERVHLMGSWFSSDFQCLIADFIRGNWSLGRDLVVNRHWKGSNSTQKQLSWTIEAPCYHQWKLTLDFQIRSVWKCPGQDFYDEVNFAAYSGFLCALWDFRLELVSNVSLMCLGSVWSSMGGETVLWTPIWSNLDQICSVLAGAYKIRWSVTLLNNCHFD